MTFKQNYYLCGMLAIFIDEMKYPTPEVRDNDNPGPTYRNMFLPRTEIPKLDLDDFTYVKLVSDDLKRRYTKKATSAYSRKIYQEVYALNRRRAAEQNPVVDEEALDNLIGE